MIGAVHFVSGKDPCQARARDCTLSPGQVPLFCAKAATAVRAERRGQTHREPGGKDEPRALRLHTRELRRAAHAAEGRAP
eukprot:6612994-Pyramimonas_sp.AAC.1